ncbi:uncharacterized protein LODBEIA_P17820 [Lodderomyces beijingensis]|uniref:AB hydrolase-1 domain-containing protein n=1 Tax=Lodderomyces beijingensis TaxID=1775926 RepID=A0ABP0ZHB8_9ASCO
MNSAEPVIEIEEEPVLISPQHSIDPGLKVLDEYTYLDDEDVSNDDEDEGVATDESEFHSARGASIPQSRSESINCRGDEEIEDEHIRAFQPVFEEDEPKDLDQKWKEEATSHHHHHHHPLSRKLTRHDAESIVGGESIASMHLEDEVEHDRPHPASDPNAPTEEQEVQVADNTFSDSKMKNYSQSQKVFSFSLPFGGLESIKHNLTRQLQNLKKDLPFVNSEEDEETTQLRREVELKLQRQQTVSTQDEANYFRDFKGLDAGRLRAIKHSIAANVNEILPQKKKELKDYESIYERIDGNIVILGGYRGSILRDSKTKKRVWIPLKAGFHLRKIDLLLGPNKEDELNAEDKIYPDGVLKNIGPIDICKKLINKLDANPNVNIQELGYDWRLSGDYASRYIEKFLQKIYEETGKPTLVIAHSMGGLMVHGALQRNPKLFRSIIYVGSPSECLNILGPVRYGDSVIFSDKILTFESNFMMRSGFVFLPMNGEAFYNKETKESYKIDFFDPDNWVEYNLNPLVSKKRKIAAEAAAAAAAAATSATAELNSSASSGINPLRNGSTQSSLQSSSSLSFPSINSIGSKLSNMYRSSSLKKRTASMPSSPTDSNYGFAGKENSAVPEDENYSFSFADSYRYLSETLAATKKYVQSLDFNPALAAEYPPMAIVYGNAIPSVRGSVVRSRDDIRNGNYYEFFYGHGDGVIHQKWLMPERKGFTYYDKMKGTGEIVGKFASNSAHVNLMTDHDTMGKALNAVFEAEQFWERKKQLQREAMAEHVTVGDKIDL